MDTVTAGALPMGQPSPSRPSPTVDTVLNTTLLPLLMMSLMRQRYTPNLARIIRVEYDYVIVGAGSAGSVLAGRLTEKPCVSVLLLEAGRPPSILTEVPAYARLFVNTDIDWRYRTTPQKYAARALINRQMPWPSGRTVGGSSVLNQLQAMRGNRKNYDHWAEEGAEGWSYEDVLPYFIKMEDNRDREFVINGYHGVGGPQTIHRPRYADEIKHPIFETAKELGYKVVDPNGPWQTGFYDLQGTIRAGQRCSTAKAYLVPAENRTNLDILPEAFVKKILIENKQAVGVRFEFRNTTYDVKARKEVIVSAGTVNTAQLLMLSGIGPKKELERHKIPVIADLPVGQNFQDHSASYLSFLLNPTIEPITVKFTNPVYIEQYIANRTGPLAGIGTIPALAFLKNWAIVPEYDFPDHQLTFAEVVSEEAVQVGVTPDFYAQYFAPYEGRAFYICISMVLQPKSRGSVTLHSPDPYEPPLIDPQYFEEPQDLVDLVEGLKTCNKFGNSPALRRVGSRPLDRLVPGCENFHLDEDKYLRCVARSLTVTRSNPVGTARMGDPKDPRTVVDPQLRVKYIKGLRVVDASIMPIIPSGNINIPVIMVAEKASDIIKETIQCPEKEEWEEHPEEPDWKEEHEDSSWKQESEDSEYSRPKKYPSWNEESEYPGKKENPSWKEESEYPGIKENPSWNEDSEHSRPEKYPGWREESEYPGKKENPSWDEDSEFSRPKEYPSWKESEYPGNKKNPSWDKDSEYSGPKKSAGWKKDTEYPGLKEIPEWEEYSRNSDWKQKSKKSDRREKPRNSDQGEGSRESGLKKPKSNKKKWKDGLNK